MTPPFYPHPSDIVWAAKATAARECEPAARSCPMPPGARCSSSPATAALCMSTPAYEPARGVCTSNARPNAGRIGSSPRMMSGGGLPVHRSDSGWVRGVCSADIQWVAGPEPGTDTGAALRDRPSSSRLATFRRRRPRRLFQERREPAPQRATGRQMVAQCFPPWGKGGVCRLPRPNGACYLEGRNGMR